MGKARATLTISAQPTSWTLLVCSSEWGGEGDHVLCDVERITTPSCACEGGLVLLNADDGGAFAFGRQAQPGRPTWNKATGGRGPQNLAPRGASHLHRLPPLLNLTST
jgi:hypothetical protein